tara:strand:- start:57 stop:500 length:444 start_codon:yes stop_codon:yes gene_type:complete
MEHLIKTIAEVKSALDQATQMLEENQTLREEIQSLKASQTSTTPERDLKVIEMAFKAGRDEVLGQLRNQSYETTHEIDESTYSDGFEIQFTQEVQVEIELESVLDYVYTEEEIDLEQLQAEILHSIDSVLENDVLTLEQITTNKIEA